MDALKVRNFISVFCDNCKSEEELAAAMHDANFVFINVAQNEYTKNIFFICQDASICIYNIETKILYSIYPPSNFSGNDDVPKDIMDECIAMVGLFLGKNGIGDVLKNVLSDVQK